MHASTTRPQRPLLLALTVLLACSGGDESGQAPTVAAGRRAIERIVVATGTIEPEGEVSVRPRIAGIIDAVRVEPGDVVEKGDPLIEIERDLLEAQMREAVAGVKQAEVRVRFTEIDVERASALQERGASSSSAYDEARATYELALAQLASARASRDTLAVHLEYATVRAPLTGRVLDVLVEEGDAVSPVTSVTGGTVMVQMAETNRLHLKGSVDENEVARLSLGQAATIRTEAFEGRRFEGRVREIAPVGNRIQNITYFEVEVEITDPDAALLRPRMSGDAEIVAEHVDDALVVPETALRYDGDDIYVLVHAGDDGEHPIFERRNVEVGIVDGDVVQILAGLHDDDVVGVQ